MNKTTKDSVMVISNMDLEAGFTALMLYALNGIRKATQQGDVPVVYFDKLNTPHFYDAQYGENIWEYFFEPVGQLSYSELQQQLESGSVSKASIHTLTGDEIAQSHHHEEDRLATFWAWKEPTDRLAWMQEKRALGRGYVKEYIHVKPAILQKTDAFSSQNFTADQVFGVHIRGTDFAYAQPTSVEVYFEELDRLIGHEKNSSCQIFLATDQAQFVDQFRERYQERLITYNSIRSDNDDAPFRLKGVSNYKKGEDVLIDILLLSRCDYLVKGAAAVGEMALWFNDTLECTDFGLNSQFEKSKLHLLKSAYLKLNIDQKSQRWLTLRRWQRVVIDFFKTTFPFSGIRRAYLYLKNR